MSSQEIKESQSITITDSTAITFSPGFSEHYYGWNVILQHCDSVGDFRTNHYREVIQQHNHYILNPRSVLEQFSGWKQSSSAIDSSISSKLDLELGDASRWKLESETDAVAARRHSSHRYLTLAFPSVFWCIYFNLFIYVLILCSET